MNKYLRVVLKKVNISTLIFLKLFDKDICQYVLSKKSLTPYPIHFLLFEYGLKKCYISDNLQRLILVFDKEKCLQDLNITNKEYYNVIDLLIDSEYFFSIIQKDIFIIIELKFDRKYLNDIKLICNTSKYSNVSEQFCKAMEPVNYSVPVISQSIVRYIVTKNIPLGIVKKSDKLREYLEKFLSVSSNEKIGDNIELYINFDPKREFISSENLDSLHKFSIFDIKL